MLFPDSVVADSPLACVIVPVPKVIGTIYVDCHPFGRLVKR